MNKNFWLQRLHFPLSLVLSGLTLSGCVERDVVYSNVSPPPVDEEVVTVNEAPPPLPVYEQPECPAPGYLWTPGYWAWNGETYYWVPGTWVEPPRPEVLWTPGYWEASGGVFFFHAGYWGPHVGFYGGVNYGHGYEGSGYEGGRWDHGQFNYNRTVNNVNVTNIHNTYNTTVINNVTVNNISYNGGSGGTSARPTEQEQVAQREPHIQPTAAQRQHVQAASSNRALFLNENHGNPPIAATPRPGAFNDHAAVASHESMPQPANLGQGFGRQQTPVPQQRAMIPVHQEPTPKSAASENQPRPQAQPPPRSGNMPAPHPQPSAPVQPSHPVSPPHSKKPQPHHDQDDRKQDR